MLLSQGEGANPPQQSQKPPEVKLLEKRWALGGQIIAGSGKVGAQAFDLDPRRSWATANLLFCERPVLQLFCGAQLDIKGMLNLKVTWWTRQQHGFKDGSRRRRSLSLMTSQLVKECHAARNQH